MAHQQHLLKELFNLIGMAADELRQGGEMRDGIAGQRLEDDVGFTAPLHLAAGGDALGIGEQDDLQQYGRVIGQSARIVVAVLGMENRQVQLVFDQVVDGVLERTGLKLVLVVDHHHGALVMVVGLEAGHVDHS